ncbi:MAG: PHB depolymerase family esterase [Pseudomonadota bacterium]
MIRAYGWILLAWLGAAVPMAHGGVPTQATIDNGRGPVRVVVPSTYDPGEPLPLVIVLHARGTSSAQISDYLGLIDLVEDGRFIHADPVGNEDELELSFWNATDACCDVFDSGVDDSGYLRGLIERIQAEYAVDPQRIHVVGASNGGFMAHRMACDHSDLVASVVSLAGATFNDDADCAADFPVHVLEVHGTADETILYDGGTTERTGNRYPGAQETVAKWARFNDCSETSRPGPESFNLDFSVAGEETTALIFDQGCAEGGSAELWTMEGATHTANLPGFAALGQENEFAPRALAWLHDHPKPEGTAGQEINYGLAGGWFNPATPGQGFLFDIEPESQFMFAAGFTFDDATGAKGIDGDEQRWLTAQGNYTGNRAELTVFQTRNGRFDDPTAPSTASVGTMVVEFSSCTAATLTYDLPDFGLAGVIPLSKLLPDQLCTRINSGDVVLAEKSTMRPEGATQDVNYGLLGGWFDPATAGQGFLFDFSTDSQFMFVAWFTFDRADAAKGSIPGAEQRWFTAQGNYSGARADLTLFATRGGVFDDPTEPITDPVGTLVIDASSCTSATVTYDLPDVGLAGQIAIEKLLEDEICTSINDAALELGR